MPNSLRLDRESLSHYIRPVEWGQLGAGPKKTNRCRAFLRHRCQCAAWILLFATGVAGLGPIPNAAAGEIRATVGGVLTAAPAIGGLALMTDGIVKPDHDMWSIGLWTAGVGPIAGHLVQGRFQASLPLMALKAGGVALMTGEARRDGFLNPHRPSGATFWMGTAIFSLSVGAEAYLGVADVLEARSWTFFPWVGRASWGVGFAFRTGPVGESD